MWNFQVVSQQRVVSLNRGLFRSVSLCCFFQSQPIIWVFFSKILLLHWHCTIIISPLITGILYKFIFWTIFDLKFNRKSFIYLKVIIFSPFFLLLLKICGHKRMVVGFTTTCAISAYHHLSCELQPLLWKGVLDTTLCDKVCQ